MPEDRAHHILGPEEPERHFNGLYSPNQDRLIGFLRTDTKELSSRVQTFKWILFLGVNPEVDLFLFSSQATSSW